MSYRMMIPPDKVEAVRMWFRERGGALVWQDHYLGEPPRPDMMTPARTEDGQDGTKFPPHWRFRDPKPITPEEIGVRDEQRVEPPLDWFPVCTYCDGSGRYPVAKIAEARGVSVEEALAWCETEAQHELSEDKQTVKCTACRETGHVERSITFGLCKRTIGHGMQRKAEKFAAKLGSDVKWDWQPIGFNKGELFFYRETIAPFTLPAGESHAHP